MHRQVLLLLLVVQTQVLRPSLPCKNAARVRDLVHLRVAQNALLCSQAGPVFDGSAASAGRGFQTVIPDTRSKSSSLDAR